MTVTEIGQLSRRQSEFLRQNGRVFGNLFGHLVKGGFDPKPGFDANYQQVESIGKSLVHFLLPLLGKIADDHLGQVKADDAGKSDNSDPYVATLAFILMLGVLGKLLKSILG